MNKTTSPDFTISINLHVDRKTIENIVNDIIEMWDDDERPHVKIVVEESKIKEAYDATSEGFKEETSLEIFNTFVEQHPFLKENNSFSFPEISEKGNVTILRGTLVSENNYTTKIQYKIVKEDGRWKIHGIEINPSED